MDLPLKTLLALLELGLQGRERVREGMGASSVEIGAAPTFDVFDYVDFSISDAMGSRRSITYMRDVLGSSPERAPKSMSRVVELSSTQTAQ